MKKKLVLSLLLTLGSNYATASVLNDAQSAVGAVVSKAESLVKNAQSDFETMLAYIKGNFHNIEGYFTSDFKQYLDAAIQDAESMAEVQAVLKMLPAAGRLLMELDSYAQEGLALALPALQSITSKAPQLIDSAENEILSHAPNRNFTIASLSLNPHNLAQKAFSNVNGTTIATVLNDVNSGVTYVTQLLSSNSDVAEVRNALNNIAGSITLDQAITDLENAFNTIKAKAEQEFATIKAKAEQEFAHLNSKDARKAAMKSMLKDARKAAMQSILDDAYNSNNAYIKYVANYCYYIVPQVEYYIRMIAAKAGPVLSLATNEVNYLLTLAPTVISAIKGLTSTGLSTAKALGISLPSEVTSVVSDIENFNLNPILADVQKVVHHLSDDVAKGLQTISSVL